MAAAKKGKLTITTTAQTFGDESKAVRQDFVLQAPAGNTGAVFLDFNGDDATADSGFNMEKGTIISSEDLPIGFSVGPFSAVGTLNDVLYYHFTKPRGS